MEPLAEPAPRPGPRCLLLLSLLLLLLQLLPAPELGPSQAQAEETDWVRLPSKCEGEGAGPAGSILPEGRGERGRVEGRGHGGSSAPEREPLRSLKPLHAWHCAGRWGPGAGRRAGLGAPGALKSAQKKQF